MLLSPSDRMALRAAKAVVAEYQRWALKRSDLRRVEELGAAIKVLHSILDEPVKTTVAK